RPAALPGEAERRYVNRGRPWAGESGDWVRARVGEDPRMRDIIAPLVLARRKPGRKSQIRQGPGRNVPVPRQGLPIPPRSGGTVGGACPRKAQPADRAAALSAGRRATSSPPSTSTGPARLGRLPS